MRWNAILGVLFLLVVVVLLGVYWFFPFGEKEFLSGTGNSNFSLGNNSSKMQFYENMRFPSSEISYRIENCTLQKKADMEQGFDIIGNLTILDFYPVDSGEEIFVTCESKNRIENVLFIAGEGGPVNITQTKKFNVIFYGEILLIKDSECSEPNIAIHELLHVLGFNHSENSGNIMYPVSKCSQTIGEDIPKFLNEIYSVQSYPDLAINNVTAVMHGRYIDTNLTIQNDGLADAEEAVLKISADGKTEKEINIEEIKIGYGRNILLTNLKISQIDVQNLEFLIEADFNELDKQNNKVLLAIKD